MCQFCMQELSLEVLVNPAMHAVRTCLKLQLCLCCCWHDLVLSTLLQVFLGLGFRIPKTPNHSQGRVLEATLAGQLT